MKRLFLPAVLLSSLSAGAQLYIDNATFFIDNGAVVTVQGDLTSTTNILVNGAAGTGKIRLGGTSAQIVNMNGNIVPNLEIDNTAGAVLGGAAKVSNTIVFTNGKISQGAYDLSLTSSAVAPSGTGLAAGTSYAVTNGTGAFKKELSAAPASSVLLPVGTATAYTPAAITLNGGTYNSSTYLAARAVPAPHPAKHPRSSDFLNNYWNLTNNIAGATISAVGNYVNPASVTGNQADIVSFTYNGSAWAKGAAQAATSITGAAVANGATDLYGMNKFILVSPKVFLQGAFDANTGLMTDKLRNSGAYSVGAYPASNIVPVSDPYRSAPYSASFSHVGNTIPETFSTNVLKDLANPNDQIVDWVFVELREKSSNTVAPVLQTRSVLLQRDGDLVDVDGISPVYFKNLDPKATYVVSIRHRNHLGISSNPASPLALGLATAGFDFTNAGNTANIFGAAGTNYTQAGAVLKNVLWGGNSKHNTSSNWSGLNNDKDYLYITVLGSNSGVPVSGYSIGDLNLNRTANWSGLNNDKDFLYQKVLNSNSGVPRGQALPN